LSFRVFRRIKRDAFVNFYSPDDIDKTYKEENSVKGKQLVLKIDTVQNLESMLSWNASPDQLLNKFIVSRGMHWGKQREKILDISNLSAILNSTDFSIIATEKDGTH
jgi:hypothetical protein